MQIRGFHIDGFGLYHNQGVQDLPGGLILFTGSNESGKTTLMEFIRFVLFGRGRERNRNDYQPLRGGNHGGRLQVGMGDGTAVAIERLARQVTVTLGPAAPEKTEPSLRLLGGIDRDTFKKIFAIGLEELQGLDVLTQEGVRNRLFAASAGLGADAVPEAVTAIDKELDTLLTKGGRSQKIYKLMHELQATDSRIKKVRGLAASYAAAQRRQEELAGQIGKNRGAIEEIRRRLHRLVQLEQAREPWAAVQQAREQAENLAFARDFPANGVARLTALKQEIDLLSRNLKGREDEVGRWTGELSRLAVDEVLLQQRQEIETLLGEREKLASALEEQPALQNQAAQAEAEFHRRLRELGLDWDSVRLAGVDTSVQVRHMVQEFHRRFDALERKHEQARARLRTMEESVKEAETLAGEAEKRWQELPRPRITDDGQWRRQQEAIREMRLWLNHRGVAAVRLHEQVSALEAAASRQVSLSQQLEEVPLALPRWLWLPLSIAGLALGGVEIYLRLYVQAGLLAGAGLGLALLFFLLSRRQDRAETSRRARLTEEAQEVAAVQQRLTDKISVLEKQLAELDRSLDSSAREAGLDRPADLAQLEQMAEDLANGVEAWRQWQVRESHCRQAADHTRQAQEKLEVARQELDQVRQELEVLQGRWQQWLEQRRFSASIRPEGFEAVLQAVETARNAEKNLGDCRRRLADTVVYLAEASRRIRGTLENCGRPAPTGIPRVADLEGLRLALADAMEARAQQTELHRKLETDSLAADQLNNQITRKAKEIQELLKTAAAADEEKFRLRAAAHEQWQEALRKIDDNELKLLTIAVLPESRTALETELSRTDPLELRAEIEQLQERLAWLTETVERDKKEAWGLERDLGELTRNEELGQLLLEERIQREQLAEAVKRWATLTVCRHLLEQARFVYERERQPQVIKEADRYLGAMAGARYRLVATLGEAGIHLEDRNSLKHTGEVAWSAGLADQVYLAIRLGLAREFSRHSEPLPVILDDVLVKFDPARRLNAARVILEFSREQQVLMFSCHPEFQEIFAELRQDPELARLSVSRLTIADGVIYPNSA